MSGRTRGRPRIEHPDAPSQDMAEEQQPPLQFATVQQVTILQDQMLTIMEMLQRMTAPPYTSEVPPTTVIPSAAKAPLATEFPLTDEILPSETIQTHETTSTSRHLIPLNWESVLNEEVIARRKSRGRPILIKEDPFTEDIMIVPLPSKFK
ncbi:hypothetical protein Fot_42187 [Forsythia ovata]|uniref:Uncharacterized protein n=1 Tax=Forsythia ovata TaxID=205694 RepID=A0ABD1RKF6_9LAMI